MIWKKIFAESDSDSSPADKPDTPAPIEPFESWVDNDPFPGQSIFRPLVYFFQHETLPKAAFTNHPELMDSLRNEEATSLDLLHCWSMAITFCEMNEILAEETTESDAFYDYSAELQGALQINSYTRDEYRIHVVSMPEPVSAGEAHYVAICQRVNETHDYISEMPGARYFLLEKTDGDEPCCLCELKIDGQHLNYGACAKLTHAEFSEQVAAQLNS